MTTPHRLTLPRLDQLFDAYWYRTAYPDLAVALNEALDHYLLHGVEQRRNPHPLFDTAWYLGRYADVAASGINPLQHYLEQGASRGYDPHPLFDSAWYLPRIPHAADDVNPLLHYLDQGAAAGLDPNPFFDTDWYLACNPDVAAARMNPLVHFVRYGAAEGRDPNPLFDLRAYRERYPALAAGGINPLTHFMLFVRDDGLSPPPAPQIEASVAGTDDEAWLQRHRWDDAAEASLREAIERLPRRPLISVVLTDTPGDASDISRFVGRLADQIYTNWEVCAFVPASLDPAQNDFPTARATCSQRVTLLEPVTRENQAWRLRAASVAVRGDHVLLMRSSHRLAQAALAMLALRITSADDADLIYFDHDHCTQDGRRHAPVFKPDWSPELLLSYSYLGPALCVSRRALISAALRVTANDDETSLHDLALCVTDHAAQVAHIPALLCHVETTTVRGTTGDSAVSPERVRLDRESGSWAVRAALERRGLSARIDRPSWARDEPVAISALRFGDHGPRVAVIIPTRNQVRVLRNLIESLAQTSYRDYSVLVVDNASDDPETLKYLASLSHEVVRIPSPQGCFNFAFINNAAVRRVDADYVLFLNDDTEVITPGWLSQMAGYLGIAGVGAVGAKLLFPGGRVQHAGVLMGIHGGQPGHAFGYLPAHAHGYLYYADVARNYLAVTAACMLTPKQLFLDSGGFDEQRFAVAYNDVDYCLRLGELGYRIVYCPTATLLHHEGLSRSRSDNPAEEAAIARRAPRVDPYYNPNLSGDGRFTPRADGTAWIFDDPRPAAESVPA